MRQLFKNIVQQHDYDRDGFVRHALLTPTEIDGLLAVYNQLNSGLEGSKFYTSHTSSDVEYKTKVDEAIQAILGPKFNDIFIDYKPVFGFYLVKAQGSETLHLHLDWQFTDERQHVGFNIWCPLVDVAKDNGALFAIPGSHKLIKVLRGYNTPNPVTFTTRPIDEKQMVTLPLKAGEALIFDLRLLHGAWPNTLPQTRIAIGMVAIPQGADILHFWASKEAREHREVEVYKMEPSFYMHNYDGTKPPQEHLKGVWNDDLREQTIENINQAYTVKKRWLERIFG